MVPHDRNGLQNLMTTGDVPESTDIQLELSGGMYPLSDNIFYHRQSTTYSQDIRTRSAKYGTGSRYPMGFYTDFLLDPTTNLYARLAAPMTSESCRANKCDVLTNHVLVSTSSTTEFRDSMDLTYMPDEIIWTNVGLRGESEV
jgi:hypothetical protein